MDKTFSNNAGSGKIPLADREQPKTTESGRDEGSDAVSSPEPDKTLETAIIIHDLGSGNDTLAAEHQYLKNRGIVHRAMRLLEEWKFLPARISSSRVPVDIIAIRKDVLMLVQVISSKHPIPDAKTLVRRFAPKISALRRMGTSMQFRKILMAFSNPCGWKHYDVLPGGLIPAWDLADAHPRRS